MCLFGNFQRRRPELTKRPYAARKPYNVQCLAEKVHCVWSQKAVEKTTLALGTSRATERKGRSIREARRDSSRCSLKEGSLNARWLLKSTKLTIRSRSVSLNKKVKMQQRQNTKKHQTSFTKCGPRHTSFKFVLQVRSKGFFLKGADRGTEVSRLRQIPYFLTHL